MLLGAGRFICECIHVLLLRSRLTIECSNLVVGGVCAPVYIFLLPALNPRPGQTIKK
jgi:hypothetical protein